MTVSEQQRANRLYYLGIGKCPRCGGANPVAPGRPLCVECQIKHDTEQTNRRNRWRAEGRCTRCGGETDPDHVQCAKCREEMKGIRNRAAKKWRDGLREEGRCTRCGIRFAEYGHSHCSICLKRHKESQFRYDPGGKKHAARRQARRDAGLCIDCGKPTDGHSRCPRCIELQRDRTRKHKILKRMDREAELARQGVYRA